MRAVNIAREIEQMHLEAGLWNIGNRRAHSEAGRARQRLGTQSMHLDREDSGQRGPVMLHQDVGGRKTELAAYPVSMHNPAADAVGPPEQALRPPHVARLQCLAYRGAGPVSYTHLTLPT